MKYLNFKINKFSTSLKNINLKRYNLSRIYKYINFKQYNFNKPFSRPNLKRYKFVPIYFLGFVTFSFFIYLIVPIFFNYNKSELENIICQDIKVKCTINGKVEYTFFPSPRIKFKNFTLDNFDGSKKKLAIFKKLLISFKFKSCVLISGILNLKNVAILNIGDHKGE